MYCLENHYLRVEINSLGAELKSIINKKDGTERFWKGDPEYWDGSSPVLFPIVGKLKEHKYKLNGETYDMPMHGFASSKKFSVIKTSEDEITFELTYDEETLKIYPFKFKLQIAYRLQGAKIEITYKVINIDNKEIYFAIGGHPGFKCPVFLGESISDYYIEFEEENETAERKLLGERNFFTHNCESLFKDNNKLTLSVELFKNNAIIMKNIKSTYLKLKSTKNDTELKFNFDEFPILAIWSPVKESPFVCFEPWESHSDYEDFQGDFKEKEGINSLNPKTDYTKRFSIEIIK